MLDRCISMQGRKEDVWLLNPLLLQKRRHKFPPKLHLIRQKRWTYGSSYSHLDPHFELCAYAKADLKFGKGKYGKGEIRIGGEKNPYFDST